MSSQTSPDEPRKLRAAIRLVLRRYARQIAPPRPTLQRADVVASTEQERERIADPGRRHWHRRRNQNGHTIAASEDPDRG